jgi:two-component system, chemotaxis family, chemotaxis protein CheY
MLPKNSVILIVDDSETVRTKLKAELKELGYLNIIESENGVKAMLRISAAEKTSTPVTLVISDWNMPQMSGLDFLKKVRETKHLSALPFIMLTSNQQLHEVLQAVNAGVSGYLVKPTTIDSLKASLEAVWKRQKTV